MSIIELQNVTKFYGKSRGIQDVNLTVEEGDIFGFIGPNGAGKSTAIRILLGLLSATSGKANVFGKDITTEKTKILSNIGYMPSEAVFYHGMRVKEIMALSAKLHKKDCSAEAAKLCDRLQLNTDKRVEELSLGNRKKVSIVCALQHKPKLYILDEPTSGLDPLMQKTFFEIIKERQAEGATVLLSSHVLSEVEKYCNRAAIIRQGKIIACDFVEALSDTKAKRVTVHGVQHIPNVEGIRDINTTSDSINFLYQGDMKELLNVLQTLPLTDFTVTEPNLDEIFMHYYAEGDER